MTYLGKALRGSALVMVLALAACSSSSSNSGGATGDGATGDCKVGTNAPFATPAGTPFTLPAGVALDGEISGDIEAGCASAPLIEYGGDLLPACLPLKNTTGADITVKIPAGLTFLAKNPETQNGIILQDHELVIPAQSSVVFQLRLFCLNEHCVYGTKADRFTFGNVTSHPGLLEIIGIARNKKIEQGVSAYVFGQLVWDVTDHEGITDEHRALLASVPDA
jgi:hypothetical protein